MITNKNPNVSTLGAVNQRPSRKDQTAEQVSSKPTLDPAEGARQLLRELNVQDIPIQPRDIAEQLQIIVWEREMESQYDGCLMRVGDTWVSCSTI